MKYIVYCTTNIVNKYIYVGVHKTENPEIFDGYIGNGLYINNFSKLEHPKTKFEFAVKEFGVKNFIRNTISIFDKEEDAYELESYIVDEKFITRNDVYNMVVGGVSGIDTSIKVYQYDSNGNFIKEHHSQVDAAKSVDRSQRSIWRAIKEKIKCADYFWTETKFDKLDLNKMHNYEDTRKIPVFQYSLDGQYDCCYDSIREASRVLGINNSNLGVAIKTGSICNGKHFTSVYCPTFSQSREKQLRNTLIYQYDLDGNFIAEYIGMASAKKELNIKSDIYKAIRLGRTAGGFQWSFVRVDKMSPIKPKSGRARKVGKFTKDNKLIETYNTLQSCKEKNGSGVIHVLNGRDKFHKGYIYKYLDN